MEKLDLQTFRELKQEVIDIRNKYKEAYETEEYLSDEEEKQFLARYKEIIGILSEHDLSDIDFEEWRGMYIGADDDFLIDFSKTKANLDFSIIEYEDFADFAFPNFRGCQIKNFDFDKYKYSPEMFDEGFRKENEGRFLSENIPEDIKESFYGGDLTLTDIRNNPELINIISEKNIDYALRYIYNYLGREEFCKLDETFIDGTFGYSWKEVLEQNPDIKTADEIMPILYKSAREKIIGYGNDGLYSRFNYSQDRLGQKFKELNPDLFLDEEVPDIIKEKYYHHILSIEDFSENLQFFEGKKISQAFVNGFSTEGQKLISLYGDNLYQLFSEYKPIMDVIVDTTIVTFTELPNDPITEEQRTEIMKTIVKKCFGEYNRFVGIEDWSMLKMVLDFVSIEDLVGADARAQALLGKYNIDDLIEAGLEFNETLSQGKLVTNLERLKKLSSIIQPEDMIHLCGRKNLYLIEKYGIDKLKEYGIKDLDELSETTKDLYKIKKMLEKRPIELINMGGNYSQQNREFIEKYGIDNIIALDEETNGMFSHQLWSNDIFLTMIAIGDSRTPKKETDKQLTYDQFKDRMYEILLHARDERGVLASRDFQDYDFIQGEFREEHQEIFVDGNLTEDVKRAFYTRHMTAEMVRQNPELIQLLQGKDLSRAFPENMTDGFWLLEEDKEGNVIGGIPNNVNMAECLSQKLGQEEFLKLCAEYGKCLDKIGLFIGEEITLEEITGIIEHTIYNDIKQRGIEYFEDLPLSFQEKHPELFLPKEIDEDIRKRFYEGKLSFEDIRKNPQLKDILRTKDISVGFGRTKYGSQMLGNGGQRYVNPIWEILSEQEIVDFAEEYGRYLKDIDQSIFVEGQNIEERKEALETNIEKNILDRKSIYNESVPEFFKKKHPEMFLADNAPEELKDLFYDRKSGNITILNRTDGKGIDFQLIKEHPEWREYLKGKDLSRAFSSEYSELFKRFDNSTLMRLGTRAPETIEKMVQNHKEEVLENWYKSTGGKFVPYHVVMLNFPEGEIDSFLANGKRWSGLMRIENYNLNDDSKTAMLKVAYSMGVFQGDDDGFNKTMKLFTDVPQELTQEEYEKVDGFFSYYGIDDVTDWKSIPTKLYSEYGDALDSFMEETFKEAYSQNDDGKYVLRIDKQKDKEKVRIIREILEKAQVPRVLTPEKAHQIFDSFSMEYNPDFVRFFYDNLEEILSNPEYTKDIATIQRQFKDIVRTNAGRRLTLDVAQDYIKSIAYTDIEVGNEGVAEQAKIAGYSQKDFEAIQSLFNEGETREFSSIPRIQGKKDGYTYEMLRLDDPLALTIGTLTDCCQEIHGAGQTSMEHSVVSPDGRVFVVRDAEERLVAQSWFWRNQYTGCFDNIEIPDRIFDLYEKEHPDRGRKGLTTDVLEVYKKATMDLMVEDERVYLELLENGTITEEQYDALILGKVTIGLGYNDIADAIQDDNTIHKETDIVGVKGTDRLPHPYTDASIQYRIGERLGAIKSEYENLYVHQDDIPVYDGTNMSNTVLLTMKRMEQGTERDNLAYLSERSDEEGLSKSQRIINSIAREYGFAPSDTKVMATARIALIYSKDKDNNVKIGDLLSSPLKNGLNEEQKQKTTAHIIHQVKKALKQIGVQNQEIDLSFLDEEQKQIIQSVMQEIEKEDDKRGER